MDEKIILKVNGEDVAMNKFVKTIIAKVNKAIITSLKIDEEEIKSIEVKITL